MLYLIGHGRRNLGKLLATGQTTSYGSGTGLDDGALQKGIAKAYTILTLGQYAGNTNITINGKTDVHANACVFDHNTGLMWSRTQSASVGPASNGLLPWTTTGVGATEEGIFPYVLAAIAASLAGYTDWRIPNSVEYNSILSYQTGLPDPTAFPAAGSNWWASNTAASSALNALNTLLTSGYPSYPRVKTDNVRVLLVRGG